jgi:hypothetical protein
MSKLIPLVILPAILFVAAGRAPAITDAAQYRGHRLLIWAIDKASHGVQGFDDQTIKPGQIVSAEPSKGYLIRFESGPIETVTVTDFRTETEEHHVRLKISHGTGSSEGTKSLASPLLHVEYGINENLASVTFAVPVGMIRSKPLLDLLGRKFAGTAEELEDLLLAAVVEPEYASYVRASHILEVYQLLGRTRRTDRWLRLLEEGTLPGRRMAAAVLMSLGNERGTRAFCNACLRAKGNEQVGLVEILCMMPPSDAALATIVELIVSPTAYVTRAPEGVGVSDIDRRYSLIRFLTSRYPRNRIGKHEEALRAWAGSKAGKDRGGRQIIEFLDAR